MNRVVRLGLFSVVLCLSLRLSSTAISFNPENDLLPKAQEFLNQNKPDSAMELAKKAQSQLQKEFEAFKSEKQRLEGLCRASSGLKDYSAKTPPPREESPECRERRELASKKQDLVERQKSVDSLFGKIFLQKGEYRLAEKFYRAQLDRKIEKEFCGIDTGVYFDLLNLYALTSDLSEGKKLIGDVERAIQCEYFINQQELLIPIEQSCREEWMDASDKGKCARSLQTLRDHLEKAYFGALSDLYQRAGFFSYQEGELDQAERHYQKALEYAAKTRAPEARSTTISQDLALAYKDMGRYAESEKLLKKVLQSHRREGDASNEAVTLGTLASLYFGQGDYRQSIRTYEECIRLKEKTFGPKHPALGYTYNNLAEVYRDLHQMDKAENLYGLAKNLWKIGNDKDRLKFAIIDNNLAEVKRMQGRLDEAEGLYQSSYRELSSMLSASSPLLAEFDDNFALFELARGNLEKAERHAQAALKIRDSLPKHFLVYKALWHLGQIHQAQNKFALAETYLENAEKQLATLANKRHPDLGRILLSQAANFAQQKETAKAELKFSQALQALEKALPAGHPDILDALKENIDFFRQVGLTGKIPSFEKKLAFHQQAGGSW